MAEFYVSSLAVAGTGSEVDPWTLAEATTNFNDSTVANGDRINVKADGTYTTAGENWTRSADGGAMVTWQGYTLTIGDGGKATIQGSGHAGAVVTASTMERCICRDLIFDGADGGTYTLQIDRYSFCINCEFKNAGSDGVLGNSDTLFVNCYAHDNAGVGFNYGYWVNCLSEGNGTFGFTGTNCRGVNCISKGNSGFNYSSNTSYWVNCISDGGTDHGWGSGYNDLLLNCVITNSPAGKEGLHQSSATLTSGFYSNICFYDNDTDTNNEGDLENKNTDNPDFNNTAIFDYTRNSTDLDGEGFSDVGAQDLDYGIDLGIGRIVPAPGVAPTFAGITQLEAVGGRLRASWSAATGTKTGYNIYLRNGSSTDLFTSTYLVANIDDALTSIIITTEADGATLLQSTSTYYVGIRADNDGTEDTNEVSLSASADGDGSTYLNMNDIITIP